MKDNFLIKTARLTIRRAHFEDWKFLQSIWISVSNTIYAQYDCPYSIDDESVKKKLELWSSYSKSYDEMFFSVCLENIVIGSVNINKDGKTDEYEIGYCFHTDYHRKGYAKESSDVDLCVSTSLSGLKYVGLAESLRIALNKKVDLIRLSDLSNNVGLVNEIMKDGIKIYG